MFAVHNKKVGYLFGAFNIHITCTEVVFVSVDQRLFEGMGLRQPC